MRLIKGWRTRLLGTVAALVGFVHQIDPQLLIDAFGPEYASKMLIGFGIVSVILRQYTTTPAGKSDA